MRVIVTGGAGFIGSHLCKRLIQQSGHEVVAVDNMITGRECNVDELANDRRFSLVRADIIDGLDIDGPVDVVMHFACPASPVDYLALPLETMRVGSEGTYHVLELARRKGARVVIASTSETYGDPLVHPQTESYWGNVNPVGPRAVYDEAKRFSEALSMSFQRQFSLNVGIIRIFNTYGPNMRERDGRVIPAFINQALRGETLTVSGDGSQTRSICYVDDLVEGILKFAESNEVGPINLGNPTETTILDLAKLIKSLVRSNSGIGYIPRPQDDPTLRCPNIAKAKELLGWTPKTSPVEGLQATIEWFRKEQNGNTPYATL